MKQDHDHPLKTATQINTKRLYKFNWTLSIIIVIYFLFSFIAKREVDSYAVYYYDLFLLILFANVCFGMLLFYINKQEAERTKASCVIQMTYLCLHLLFAVLLSKHDPHMQALWIACIGIGVLFLIPPFAGIFMYLLTWIASSIVLSPYDEFARMEWPIHPSIRTALPEGLGFVASIIIWRSYTKSYKQHMLMNIEQTRLIEKNNSLQALAVQDPLTGLLNRTRFVDLVRAQLHKQNNKEASILIIDIDFFKHVNDQFGHPAGDQVLKDLSAMLMRYFPPPSLSARLGGEEFIIFLPNTHIEQARQLAEMLRENIATFPFSYKHHTIHITASFGIAQATHSFQHSYSKADQALYIAKQNGRNRVVVIST
ncbi:GGDEF domain-containing protein [Anoxybacillus kestanbolensis]|uniref:GGDEF domain-containing protein n=1 Tax=Anoxybacillus kestanbolensis TaxID=227476 RepID=UPI00208DD13A|nr:GGDEF domain-containing protein [Anoxybacillus kestanbolensis]MCL9970818.1 GGDEF domain-containing protein [Anoxybacillus kestanbolensis]